jgi:hypothetical protein
MSITASLMVTLRCAREDDGDLDADTEQIIRRRMRERGISFKEAVNDAIRRSSGRPAGERPFRTEPAALGESRVSLDQALQIAGDLEDDELLKRMRAGS